MSSAHHSALFFIQPGITLSYPVPCSVGGIFMMSFEISHCIPETNPESGIRSSAHHSALFFIQPGILVSDSVATIGFDADLIPAHQPQM